MQNVEWYRERRRTASLSDLDKQIIAEDYNEITGGDFQADFKLTCPNKYTDAIDKILYTMAQQQNTSGYILKSGIAFRYKGKIITRSNITKEAAEWYIKQNLDNRNDFEELANDWDSYEQAEQKTASK